MKYLSRLGHCTIALLILLLLTPHPATITAAPLYNVIDVPCEANGAVIGLAIEEANDNPGLDTINLAANCTYSLTFAYAYGNGHNGLPLITDDLIIEGNGSRLERATAIKFRLMQTSVNVPLTIKNLTLANGYTDDPNDTEPDGGAVYAVGDLTLENVTVLDNFAHGAGGGIAVIGQALIIKKSHFENNRADGDVGGAIYAYAEAEFDDVDVIDNYAMYHGGGAYLENKAAIDKSRFIGNQADFGNGGGLNIGGGAYSSLFYSTFVDNSGSENGGGLFVSGEGVGVIENYFGENRAYHGGGIYVQDSRINLQRSEFVNNISSQDQANGVFLASSADSENTMINNLFVGNHSYSGGTTVKVNHGQSARLYFHQNTVVAPDNGTNTAVDITGGAVTYLLNNIIDSYSIGIAANNGSASTGYNMYLTFDQANAEVGLVHPFEPNAGKFFAAPRSQFVNPAAGDYHLRSDSGAIDQGHEFSTLYYDIEGNSRPQAEGYDLGAYEFVPAGLAPIAVDDSYSTPVDTPLTVSIPGVLDNDTPGESGRTKVSLISSPANGTVDLTTDGNFTYTPNSGFDGEDSFTYQVSDLGILSNEATVRIQVGSSSGEPGPDQPNPDTPMEHQHFLPLLRR